MLFLDKLFTRKDPQVPVPLVANYVEQMWFAAGYRAAVIDQFNSDPEKYGAKKEPDIMVEGEPFAPSAFRLPTDRTGPVKVEKGVLTESITDDDEED